MGNEFDRFKFEPINYDPNKHKWNDISKQPLKFQSIKFDFDWVELKVCTIQCGVYKSIVLDS
jgi:hypothetical protein